MPPPTGPPTTPMDALAWAQEAITSNPRRCIYDTHVYKRLRERKISERSIWYAIRNATSCIAYIPDRKPLAGGTCWRITGPPAPGDHCILVSWRMTMIHCSACHDGTMFSGYIDNHDIGPLLGLDGVIVSRAPALICDRCGHVMLEGDVIEAARRKLARLLIERCVELLPAEARFLRETMNMTQAELAERLHIIRGTVTRWENSDEPLGPIQSFALRTLAAWSLENGEKLARAIAARNEGPGAARPAPPYLLDAVAA